MSNRNQNNRQNACEEDIVGSELVAFRESERRAREILKHDEDVVERDSRRALPDEQQTESGVDRAQNAEGHFARAQSRDDGDDEEEDQTGGRRPRRSVEVVSEEKRAVVAIEVALIYGPNSRRKQVFPDTLGKSGERIFFCEICVNRRRPKEFLGW